jgi:hypothetical protein
LANGQTDRTLVPYSNSVGKLDQAGRPASASTGLYRQKGKINPGDTGSQPNHYISGETSKQQISIFLCLTQWYFVYFLAAITFVWEPLEVLP